MSRLLIKNFYVDGLKCRRNAKQLVLCENKSVLAGH